MAINTPSPTLADAAPRRAWAMGMMILASVVISFSGLVIRMIDDADAWQIMFYRAIALAAGIMLVMLIRYGRETPTRIKGIGWPGFWAGVVMTGASLAFLQSITNTTVANTLFMLSAIPFFTAGLAWIFLREPLLRATVLTMLAAACGIIVMVSGGISAGSLYGNVMGLVTALCFSAYAVIVRHHRDIEMLPVLIVAGLLSIVLCLFLRWGDLDIPMRDILLCFLLGAVLSGGTNALFIAAAKHLLAAELTLFMLLEFALGPLWVWLIVKEVPTGATILGGAIVIGSVALRSLLELTRTKRRGRGTVPPL
jgi:drug/metabolite transporter (DMT)-like permease